MSYATPFPLAGRTPTAEVERAYRYCRALTRRHARSFHFCARFLPREKRRAIYAVNALCRRVDDEVDAAGVRDEREARAAVERWRVELDRVYRGRYEADDSSRQEGGEESSCRGSLSPVLVAWRDMLARHKIAQELPLELMRGVLMDTCRKSYETWEGLRVYCYRVAPVVGLMSSEVFGDRRPETLRYAEALGLAMQLTNILRDVGEDLALGRVYLPREDLRRFGLAEDDLRRGRVTDEFRALMRFEIERARSTARPSRASRSSNGTRASRCCSPRVSTRASSTKSSAPTSTSSPAAHTSPSRRNSAPPRASGARREDCRQPSVRTPPGVFTRAAARPPRHRNSTPFGRKSYCARARRFATMRGTRSNSPRESVERHTRPLSGPEPRLSA